MKLHQIFGTPPFVALGIAMTRILPPKVGYWIAARGARSMARRRSLLFRTVRENLRHVAGDRVTPEELDALAESAIAHAGRTYVDMFRRSVQDYTRSKQQIVAPVPEEWERAKEVLQDSRGTIIAGIHMSNFDLAAQWIAAQGSEIQALSLPNPNAGTRLLNALRRHRGLIVTPISAASLRAAVKRLRAGGIVATGVDRPAQDGGEMLPFFGSPARLSTGYIRLAQQTNSRILVASCRQEPNGCYSIHIAPPIEPYRTGNRDEDARHTAQRVLAICEEMIRQAPDQWLMLVPVWEETASCPEE